MRFIAAAEWRANAEAPRLEALAGRPCFIGLDLSASRDLTALVSVFPAEDGRIDVVPRFYLPEEGLPEKSEADRTPWDQWARSGHLVAMPGAVVDPAYIAHDLAKLAAAHDVRGVAYDRWRIEDMRRELAAIGADLPLRDFGQGFRDMAPAIDLLERLVAEGRLRHGGHPILTMCASNAVIERDAAGNRKLAKHKSSGKIDGLVALAMALAISGREEVVPEAQGRAGRVANPFAMDRRERHEGRGVFAVFLNVPPERRDDLFYPMQGDTAVVIVDGERVMRQRSIRNCGGGACAPWRSNDSQPDFA